jgi:hypothetical protein
VNRGGEAGAGRSQASFAVAPHPIGSTTRREPATLHHCNYSRRQHGNRGGTPKGRPCLRCAAAIISEVLSESKACYAKIQKLLNGILITSRTLRRFFDAYNISMVPDFLLADILYNWDAIGRISKLAVELGALTLDFMAEWRENQVEAPANQPENWVMYFNSSLKLGGGGAGVLFISPKGEQLKYVFQILFEVSNNKAEYDALLHGLRLTVSLGIK